MPITPETTPAAENDAQAAVATPSATVPHPPSDGAGAADPGPPCQSAITGKRSSGKRGLHPGDMVDPRHADRREIHDLLKFLAAVVLVLLVCGIIAWIMLGGNFPLPWRMK